MSDYAPSHGSADEVAGKLATATAGWIILASLLCGAGLFLLAYFITFFAWWSFSGVLMVLAGAAIFFKTWTGPESA
jgi:hypothetical protein